MSKENMLNNNNNKKTPTSSLLSIVFLYTKAIMRDNILLGKKDAKFGKLLPEVHIYLELFYLLRKTGYVCKNSKHICKPKSNLQIN